MKNAKKFIETYEELAEESFRKWGYYYPPKTWQEFDSRNYTYFEKYLKDKEDVIKNTKSYVRLAGKMNDFGFYNLYQNFDFENLNNILFQTSRQMLLNRGMLASGTDHCNVLFNTFRSFSCNDFSVIDHFFPKELPQSKGKYYTEVSVNLLKVLYYQQKQFENKALEKADKFLSKKITGWEKHTIQYFKALVNNDAKGASNCLKELCTAYQKKEYSVNKLSNQLAKYFAYEINGMYRFAMIVNRELFEEIKQPSHHCFSNKFEQWQKENNFPKGKVFYKYPKEMEFINAIFEAELPTVELYNPYPDRKKVELFKNVEKFVKDLTENANKKHKKNHS
ncbi:hypothetical protein J4050_07530 [Winogradskyella sp. DF17]|uniref:Uncharacterized protein n=1 Tax=Winogradskyella pelagia TaxID=2819984 RepID=A0ABS3T3Y9_9FLAO|nr:hypothetical protein [Winogradskyella sp. DF17]MBO3116591.1 hypothetical protein [Winogradskyella sp. DF17]